MADGWGGVLNYVCSVHDSFVDLKKRGLHLCVFFEVIIIDKPKKRERRIL